MADFPSSSPPPLTGPPARPPWIRGAGIAGATLGITVVALAYPVLARGPELGRCVRNLGVALPALLRSTLGGDGQLGSALVASSWRHPWFLLGLLLVPLVLWRGTLGEDRRTPRLRLGTVAAFRAGPLGPRVWLRDVPGVVRAIALGMLVTALAGPLNTLRPQISEEEGIDAVVVVDLSESMQAVLENVPDTLAHFLDLKSRAHLPTRMDVAKAVIRDFISRRKSDRIGVVVFGQDAYVLSPPTLDYQLLDSLVSRLEIGVLPGGATAIGDALGVGVARLRRSQVKSKTIILLTDGENNAGRVSPEYAARLATNQGVKVFTILIGQGDVALVQDGYDLMGHPHYVRTRGAPVNPELLKTIADKTGGEAYVATDGAALAASFHEVLDELEKTKLAATLQTYEDLFRFLLLPGVLLLAVDALLRSLVLRRFP